MRYMSGNRALIRFNGTIVGFGTTSASFDNDFGQQEIRALGSAKVQELQDGAHRFTVTLTSHYIPDKAIRDQIFHNEDEFAETNQVDIECMDRVTGKVLERYVKCRRSRSGSQISANTPSTESVTFGAVDRETPQAL